MIEKILEFMKEAGEIALSYQESIDTDFGGDFKNETVYSVVTKADLEISRAFKEFIENNFSDLDYIIVDEESIASVGSSPLEKVCNTSFVFVLDPIDGTQPFSLLMPEFGISVGVLKFGKPYMGAIYTPATKELAYFDGSKAYWLRDAFEDSQKKVELLPKECDEKAFVFINPWRSKLNDNVRFAKTTCITLYSAVVHFLYMATGRGKCYYFGVFPWDMAGAWALLKYLGFEFMNYNTGEVLERLDKDKFYDNLVIRDLHIVCKPKDFDYLKSIVDLREWRG